MNKVVWALFLSIFALGFWIEMPSVQRGLALLALGLSGILFLTVPLNRWFDKRLTLRASLVAMVPVILFFMEKQSKFSINEFFHMLYFVVLIGLYHYREEKLYAGVASLCALLLSWKYIYIGLVSPEHFKLPQFIVAALLYVLVTGILWLGLKLNREKLQGTELNQRLKERQVSLENTNNQLESLMDQVESLTIYSERQKMAREIHDTVGHELTALTMKLQLCQHFYPSDQEKSMEMLEESIGDSRRALKLTRQVVETLTTSRRSPEDLIQLVKRHEAPLGLEVHLEGESHVLSLGVEGSHVAYRFIQEAVTNCIKHSNAKNLWIRVEAKGKEIQIRIEDDGRHLIDVSELREGFGLKGMRERAEEIGGKFSYGIAEGFQLQMTLPLNEEAMR